MPNSITITIRFLKIIKNDPTYWSQDSLKGQKDICIVNSPIQKKYPLELIFPSTQELLNNPQQLWRLCNLWLDKEQLEEDDFMGGVCFDVAGIPWGYTKDELIIGNSFDYIGYMGCWLDCFPRGAVAPQKPFVSIYGDIFEFRKIGKYLEIYFKGDKNRTKEDFLRFYPAYMYYPIQVKFNYFIHQLWTAFDNYLLFIDEIKQLLKPENFRTIPTSQFYNKRGTILKYLTNFY